MRWKVGENWKPQYCCHAPWPNYPSESELDLFIVSKCVRSRIMQGHGPVTHWGSWFCSRTKVKRPGAALHPQHRLGSRSICIPLPRTAGFGCHLESSTCCSTQHSTAAFISTAEHQMLAGTAQPRVLTLSHWSLYTAGTVATPGQSELPLLEAVCVRVVEIAAPPGSLSCEPSSTPS